MKNLKKFLGVSALTLAFALASCGQGQQTGTNGPQASTTEPASVDVSAILAGYDKELSTTVKLTYTADYNVDVNANGGTANMSSFMHQIRAVSVIEMDLGSDLYLKITKTKKDLIAADPSESTVEHLLYKGTDGKYYYGNSSEEAKEITDAKAKIAEVFSTVTYEQAGGLTLDSLLYNSNDKNYELANFGLTETFTVEELTDPEYSVENDALTVVYKPDYIGYQTDGGMSDFSNKEEGKPAATCTIKTNNKGQVTSWEEKYNDASLDFAIMNPAPTVIITGERKFTAEYGVEIVKETGVEAVKSTVSYQTVEGGTFVVKSLVLQGFVMEELANGAEISADKFIAIMPTPQEGKKVKLVSVNGIDKTAVPVANAGGYYCFTVAPGENVIVVEFEDAEVVEVNAATAKYSNVAGGTFAVMTCAMGDFQNMAPVENGGSLDTTKILCVKPTAAEGYEIKAVYVNGNSTPMIDPAQAGGFYCFKISEGENSIVVEFKKTTPEGNYVVYSQAEGGMFTVCSFQLPQTFTPIADGDSIPEGQYIAIKAVANNGMVIDTISVNGVIETVLPPANAGGWYCFNAAQGANDIVVTFKTVA